MILLIFGLFAVFQFPNITYAEDEKILDKGAYCGFYQPFYVTPTMKSKTLEGYKCIEGTVCGYASVCDELPASATEAGYKGKPRFACIPPEWVQQRQDQLTACIQGGPEKAAEEAKKTKADNACLAQATSTERGIFTRDLSPKCFACGECTQKDVFQEFINIFTFILQISGSLAVLVIVIGGIMYMTAAGDQQKTQKAKGALTAAIIGLIIVLVAFTLITFVMNLLGYSNAGSWYSPSLK